MNLNDIIENAIISHNVNGLSWNEIRCSIPFDSDANVRARLIVAMIDDGWFSNDEIDTFTAKQFEEKANRIRIEREVFGSK